MVFLYVACCSVNVSVWLACLTVFVNCLVIQFAMCLGEVAILLLNVMGEMVNSVIKSWIKKILSFIGRVLVVNNLCAVKIVVCSIGVAGYTLLYIVPSKLFCMTRSSLD